jgi:hypothetical protein
VSLYRSEQFIFTIAVSRRNDVLIKVGVNALRIFALITLILGILLWLNVLPAGVVMIHMLLGLLAMFSLWAIAFGAATAPKGASLGLAIGGFVLGLILPIIGIGQLNFLYLNPSMHWIIQVIHLLFGIAAIGFGEATAARMRRLNKTA